MTRLSSENNNPLKQLLQCQRAVYTSRKRNAIAQLGGLIVSKKIALYATAYAYWHQ